MTNRDRLALRVAAIRTHNASIRQLRLTLPEGGILPGFEPGAHIRVEVNLPGGISDWRHYSLVDFTGDASATAAPHSYVIAVRREDSGRGGSRFIHELKEGDLVTVETPANDFPLAAHKSQAVLLAGGIGITPMTAMAARLVAEARPLRIYYAGRSRSSMAFLPELTQLLGDSLHVHADDEAGAPLDVTSVVAACSPEDHLYVCDPKPMIDGTRTAALARGWPESHVHSELFAAPAAEAGDHAFDVVLASSRKTFTVGAAQSVLDCLIENDCDPLFDCRRGECGVCTVAVIEGEIDHRDHFLSDAEKAAGNVMQVCVSRARGARLVLDM